MTDIRTIPCACGRVELEARGAPIISAACYCDDCQEAASRIEGLPGAKQVKGSDGGTEYLVYRKDRVRYTKGADLLQRHKLRESSPTNRWVAGCCNSAMSVNFDDARHWVDVYRLRLADNAPPLKMLVCTRFKPEGVELRPGVPHYPRYSFRFIAKLIGARFAMMFSS